MRRKSSTPLTLSAPKRRKMRSSSERKKWVEPGSPWRPERPRSWSSMRRDSCRLVPITCRPPSSATSRRSGLRTSSKAWRTPSYASRARSVAPPSIMSAADAATASSSSRLCRSGKGGVGREIGGRSGGGRGGDREEVQGAAGKSRSHLQPRVVGDVERAVAAAALVVSGRRRARLLGIGRRRVRNQALGLVIEGARVEVGGDRRHGDAHSRGELSWQGRERVPFRGGGRGAAERADDALMTR